MYLNLRQKSYKKKQNPLKSPGVVKDDHSKDSGRLCLKRYMCSNVFFNKEILEDMNDIPWKTRKPYTISCYVLWFARTTWTNKTIHFWWYQVMNSHHNLSSDTNRAQGFVVVPWCADWRLQGNSCLQLPTRSLCWRIRRRRCDSWNSCPLRCWRCVRNSSNSFVE